MRFNFSQPVLAAALAMAALGSQAADVPHPGLRFMMTAGITAGGDKIDTVAYTNGTSQDIRAGGLITTGLGAIWQPEDTDFSLQLTANYQFDSGYGNNGDVYFHRFPIELMGFYNINESWRVGLGGRRVLSPKYRYDVGSKTINRKYKDTYGAVAEVGYFVTPQVLLSLRYVKEEYEEDSPYSFGEKVDGSHVGFTGSFIF